MKIITAFLLLLSVGSITAQERSRTTDSVSINYLKTANQSATLYYGVEYESYTQAKNNPYLTKSPCTRASLSYRNVVYTEVCLRLDLWKDELTVLSPDSRYFVLFPEDVEYAEMFNKHVFYHKTDSFLNSPSTGYYFLLYDNNCRVLEKKYATLIQRDKTVRTEWTIIDFDIKTHYYLLKDNVYHLIKNKNDLLNALSPYKKELKQFISSNRLSFRKNAAELLIQTTGEYEKLVANPSVN